MPAKDELKTAIQACADASGDLDLRVGIGTPNIKIEVRNETVLTGQAYEIPGFLDCLLEGIANTSLGRTGQATISDLNTSVAVSLTPAESNTNYKVFLTPVATGGTPAANSTVITLVSKSTSSFTVNVQAAPGLTNSITFDWLLVR